MTTFIGEYKIDDSICDRLIEHHKNGKKKQGLSGYDMIDKDTKDSIDVAGKDIPYYYDYLKVCIEKYKQTYIFSDKDQYYYDVLECPNIQYYPPGGGFKIWHYENTWQRDVNNPNDLTMAKRHLVFMTYLNDVTDEGETEFFYQKRIIQPRKGLTLIWPASWTHTHKGVPSLTQEKYIITGWISFRDYVDQK